VIRNEKKFKSGICPVCKSEFRTQRGHMPERKYCSDSCRRKAMRARRAVAATR
jgi:hypothetical protein